VSPGDETVLAVYEQELRTNFLKNKEVRRQKKHYLTSNKEEEVKNQGKERKRRQTFV